jgi:hypothetical protein
VTHVLRLEKVASGICGLIFNLRYYDGMARMLDGRQAFLRLISGEPVTAFIDQLPERQVAGVR